MRKRCHFGCVVCGSAIVQYHHFDPLFEDATEHRPEGITLLCGGCHDKATRGLLSDFTVREYDRNPCCARHPTSHLMDLRNPSRIVAGGAVFGTGPPIVVDGAPLFEVVLSDGVACINAKFSVEAGRTVVEIRENELLVQHGSWDATFIGTQFVVRCAPGKIAFECIMHPPHGLYLRSIDFARPPYRVLSDETGFNLFNQNGKITDLKAGYVWALGGSVEMAADRFQVLGGLGLVPYPVVRSNN